MSASIASILVVLGAGQSCALLIHGLTWWLRRKALWLIALAGAGTVALVAYVYVTVDFGMPVPGPNPPAYVPPSSNLRDCIWSALLFLTPSAVMGLYQSFLLERRWQWWLWPLATFAVAFEFGCVIFFCIVASIVNFRLHNPLILQQQGVFFKAFLGVWLALALLRPLVIKFLRPVRPILKRLQEEMLQRSHTWEGAP